MHRECSENHTMNFRSSTCHDRTLWLHECRGMKLHKQVCSEDQAMKETAFGADTITQSPFESPRVTFTLPSSHLTLHQNPSGCNLLYSLLPAKAMHSSLPQLSGRTVPYHQPSPMHATNSKAILLYRRWVQHNSNRCAEGLGRKVASELCSYYTGVA
jgi:hypothetical protein